MSFTHFDPGDEGRREALCTLGNGYFATRGAAPEARADGVHYPGTYAAGCYNRISSTLSGREVEYESLVNAPNWLFLTFRFNDGPWFDVRDVDLLDHEQELDLERGVLVRRLRFRDPHGRTTRLVQRRFVHMAHPHVAGLECALSAEDWSGTVTFRSGIDGRVTNSGVERYRPLGGEHLVDHASFEVATDVVALRAWTSQSRIQIAEACRTRTFSGDSPLDPDVRTVRHDGVVAHDVPVWMGPEEEVRLEKVVGLYTSRDPAIAHPLGESVEDVREAGEFAELLHSHTVAVKRLWGRFRLSFSASEHAQQAVRLHVFHLMQTLSPHTTDVDVGVPARGLHGEAYRGHVFWDELFVLPTLTLRVPRLARSLLLYRYRRLRQARRAARRAGCAGAMFPWQSGSNGREESPGMHLNPRSGRWLPDDTHLQYHVGIAIAHNTWYFYRASGDEEFLADVGAELIAEVARFFASIADYDHSRDRYVIRGVVGPDEFHTRYPGREHAGIDNNAYVNVMVAWLCRTAVTALDDLPAPRRRHLCDSLGLSRGEVDRWERMAQRMYVPLRDNGIIDQFDGYEDLLELDWESYRGRYGDVHRLDRILEAEGDDVNRYQVSKQADVLMLFYLLSREEFDFLLTELGYATERDTIPKNIDHYLQRTSHGSTLSAVVHAWVLARANRQRALEFFNRALASDIHDVQGGTTAEGIHLAAMTGSIDLLQRCFAGIDVRGGTLHINPHWPAELGPLVLPVEFRGQTVTVTITGRTATVRTAPDSGSGAVLCACGSRTARLSPGESARFSLEPAARGEPVDSPAGTGPVNAGGEQVHDRRGLQPP